MSVPLEVLHAYVGAYRGPWGAMSVIQNPEFRLHDGVLWVTKNGWRESTELAPLSDTVFEPYNDGPAYRFERGPDGRVDTVVEIHISGPWPMKGE